MADSDDQKRRATTGGNKPRRESPFKPAGAAPLELPKSGGALRGIGEKFRSGGPTGTGGMSIPLPISACRGGIEPSLSLDYDSGQGHGPHGIGFRVPVAHISRRTDKGMPLYADADESDIFVLSGQEDLVPVLTSAANVWFHAAGKDGNFRVDAYRPRVEGLFARVERRTNVLTGYAHWRSITHDNVTSIYGLSGGARITDPNNPLHVFTWLIEATFDSLGNATFYEYKAEDLIGVLASDVAEAPRFKQPPANRYLKRVHYGNTAPLATRNPTYADLTGLAWLFEAVFDYGEHPNDLPAESAPWPVRPDPFSSYRSGFEIRTYRLCRRFLMFHEMPLQLGAPARLVKALEFTYDEQPTITYLTKVRSVGYSWDAANVVTKAYAPTLVLDYTRVGVLATETQSIDAQSLAQIPGGLGNRYQLVDLDGEGIAGILNEAASPAPALYYKRNLGGGSFGGEERLPSQPAAQAIGGGAQLLSLNADGRLDVAFLSGPTPGYYERTRSFQWSSFMPFRSVPRLDLNARGTHFLDVDGDGLTDILVAIDDAFVWYPSLSREGFGPGQRVSRAHDEDRGAVVLTTDDYESVFLADMSGDGLSDLVRVRNGSVCYWPNLGYGRFGEKITMHGAPLFDTPDLFDPRRVRFGDIDGTGTTDIVYLSRHGADVYFNQAGNGWASAIRVPLPLEETMSSVRLADLLGSGTSCLVWSSTEPAAASSSMRYIDLLHSIKPHLLNQVVNGIGATTTIRYAPSTQYYLEDRLAGHPWATRLPFVVQTVSRVETVDAVSLAKSVVRHRYAHGFYDGVEREFRGFARIDSWDAESLSSDHGAGPAPGQLAISAGGEIAGADGNEYDLPPVHTISWFHTGAWNGERDDLRATLAAEYYAGDAAGARLEATLLPTGLLPPALREAYRALKGRPLREEVYAEDGGPQYALPYSVKEWRYEVRELQPISTQRHGVYHPIERETVISHYERSAADPRLEHHLSLQVDPLGHVVREASLSYARRAPSPPATSDPAQNVVLATALASTVAAPISLPYDYRHGVVTESIRYELALNPSSSLFDLDTVDAAMLGAAIVPFDGAAAIGSMRTLEQVRHVYWSDDLAAALPQGQVESRALVYDHLALALPATLCAAVFGADIAAGELTGAAGYLAVNGDYWTHAGITNYDAAHFYLPLSFQDPFGNKASLLYDAAKLFVLESHTSDNAAFDNVTTVAIDYRVLRPYLLTDPNGNQTAVAYDALGMVVATAVMGRLGAGEGDTLADPTTRIEYDLLAWQMSGTPASVHTSVRQQHGAANPGWFEAYSYSDGLGHEVLKKAQAEPGPDGAARWAATGRTVFDNKHNSIKTYEPYFSSSPAYDAEAALLSTGYAEITRYDPLSRVIRIDYPDGSFAATEWDAWSEVRSDANDTVLGSAWYADASSRPTSDPLNRAAALAAKCANTPAVRLLDPLGRAIVSIADNGAAGKLATHTLLDIQGNELRITDPSGVATLIQTFDAQGNSLRHVSADAGTSRAVVDGIGRPYRAWDPRGFAELKSYDVLRRLTQIQITPPGGAAFLSEQLVYGEGLAQPNLRGHLYQHFDGAGVLTNASYDLEGRITHATRQLAANYQGTPAWSFPGAAPGAAGYLPAAFGAGLLENDVFNTWTTFDAMSRVVSLTTHDMTVVLPVYNEASLLGSITAYLAGGASPSAIVTRVDYDARGQRTSVKYPAGLQTSYTYDDRTHLVLRVQTLRAADAAILQDLNYTYDPAHNIVQITDRAQQTVYFSGTVTSGTQLFEYDSIYRLVSATGREQPGQVGYALSPNGYAEAPYSNIPHRNDLQALLAYLQTYSYDATGNLLSTVHQAGAAGWTRTQVYTAGSNRLDRVSMPGDPAAGPYSGLHTYDAAGNILAMPNLKGMTWDHAGRLISGDLQGGGTAYFAYDASGQRIRKLVQQANRIFERVYVGNYERYRETNGAALPGALTLERDSVHIYDGHRRFALVETKTADTSVRNLVPTPLFRLQFGNHLGTACLETDLTGAIISYEEYYPYGGSSFRAGDTDKRYRFTGKERDEETGLYYHGHRYYAPWLSRWISADPLVLGDGANGYAYAANNPIKYSDPTGLIQWPSWRTVAVIAAVVVVGTVVTIATAGAAGPVIAAAVASVGVSGTAATVATGVVVGAVAGAAGGVASEAARTGITEGRLPTRAELKKAAISGAIGGAVTGGIGAAASAARAGATATRAAASATRAARVAKAVAGTAKAGATGALASASGNVGAQAVLTGHVDLAEVKTAAIAGFAGGVAAHGVSGVASKAAGVVRNAIGAKGASAAPAAVEQPAYGASGKPLLPNLSDSEIDAAFANRRLGPLVSAPAQDVAGVGPKLGTSPNIWYHDNLRVQGVKDAPGGRPVNIRVHSENAKYPGSGYTMQINTHVTNPATQGGASQYMTAEGTWHGLDKDNQALMQSLHIPAGSH
jgi:RHS repeat-associated protein